MNQAEEKLTNWATWEVVRGLGGSLNSPKFRRAMLKYALEAEELGNMRLGDATREREQ